MKIRDGEPLGSTFRGLAEYAILRNEATACGHRVADWDAVGVAAGSRARKRAVASWTRWREAALVWAFDAGRSHTRLAYGDLRALDVNPGVRVLRVVRLGDCMEKPPPAGDGPICASV